MCITERKVYVISNVFPMKRLQGVREGQGGLSFPLGAVTSNMEC